MPLFIRRGPREVRLLSFRYRAWDGAHARAYVVVPAWYRRGDAPSLPLVISSHGRGGGALGPVYRWRYLEGRDGFILVSPSGHGVHYAAYSYAAPGQIADLMRMPRFIHRAFPWIHIDPRRIYAAGASMGGMEALVLAARYPDRIAACLSVDAVTDLAARYWAMPFSFHTGVAVQDILRAEVGGSPEQVPLAYAARSSLFWARNLAFDRVPLLIYWSRKDCEVIHQRTQQSGRLCRRILALDPQAPLTEIVTDLGHGGAYSFKTRLPQALAFLRPDGHWRKLPTRAPKHWQYTSPLRSATVWGYRIVAQCGRPGFWCVKIAGRGLMRVSSPRPLTISMPTVPGAQATVLVDGRVVLMQTLRRRLTVHLPPGRATVRLSL